MLDDDIVGSKEERVFRFWTNLLGVEDVFIIISTKKPPTDSC